MRRASTRSNRRETKSTGQKERNEKKDNNLKKTTVHKYHTE
jgi:hypothetical protein